MQIQVKDIVKWVEEFSIIVNYGEVIRVNKLTYTIRNSFTGELERVAKQLVYWS